MRERESFMTEEFRSGFVTLVGRPNAGKSTLINAVVGHKVAITSNTAQTTRHRFRAIVTREDMQMIMVDTPGMHKPHDALGEELNTSAIKAMEDVDVVAFLVDASKPVGTGDEWVARQVREVRGARKILVITKADLVSKETAIQQLEAARALGTWDDEVVLSSKNGFNVEGFVQAVAKWLPEGPKWFPEDMDHKTPLVKRFSRRIIAEFAVLARLGGNRFPPLTCAVQTASEVNVEVRVSLAKPRRNIHVRYR